MILKTAYPVRWHLLEGLEVSICPDAVNLKMRGLFQAAGYWRVRKSPTSPVDSTQPQTAGNKRLMKPPGVLLF